MRASWTAAPARLRSTAFALAALFTLTAPAAAAIQCSDYGTYSVRIFNNTPDTNIFPVLATNTTKVDEWLQSAFRVPQTQIKLLTYAHDFVYRVYVKPKVGLAPGESITLTMPICSQLLPNPNGTVPDEYIDWWNGVRVYIFDSPTGAGAPPTLTNLFDTDSKNPVNPLTSDRPTCDKCPVTSPPIYKSPIAFKSNNPMQLTEYTFSDIDKRGTTYQLVTSTPMVDYDISYVDHAYLPVAMGPFNNNEIGWIGSISPIPTFRTHLNEFLLQYGGWPRYLDPISQKAYLRVPGAYNAFAEWNPKQTDLIEEPGASVKNLQKQWLACTTQAVPGALCDDIRLVNTFFLKNYSQYYAMWLGGDCKLQPNNDPLAPTPPMQNNPDTGQPGMIPHVYGWVQFNEFCSGGAAANDLQNTPNFKTAHKTYISAQYDKPIGKFNPYVNLIHGADFLNMRGSYAFSIDDDVGNMHVEGNGVILTVGGVNGLENDVEYDPKNIVHVNLGDPKPLKRPAWAQYGFCAGQPGRDIKSLDVQITSERFPCAVALTDAIGRQYTFTLSAPPYPDKSQNSRAMILSCTAPTQAWCNSLHGFTQTIPDPPGIQNVVIAEAPSPP